MAATFFHDLVRSDGLPVTVEYSETGGEPYFDSPGHPCDGGGSAPEICIVDAWPNTRWMERLSSLSLAFGYSSSWSRRFVAALVNAAIRATKWRLLSDDERERMEIWIAENVPPHEYEPDWEDHS